MAFFYNTRVSQKFCNILVVRIHGFFFNTWVSQKFCNILVVRIHGFFCNTWVSQKFCNILVIRIHGFFCNTWVSQMFCNIFETWGTIRQLRMVLQRSCTWPTTLNWYSPCATRWIFLYGLEYGPAILAFRPDRLGSWNPSEEFLYSDQLPLSHNKYILVDSAL